MTTWNVRWIVSVTDFLLILALLLDIEGGTWLKLEWFVALKLGTKLNSFEVIERAPRDIHLAPVLCLFPFLSSTIDEEGERRTQQNHCEAVELYPRIGVNGDLIPFLPVSLFILPKYHCPSSAWTVICSRPSRGYQLLSLKLHLLCLLYDNQLNDQ